VRRQAIEGFRRLRTAGLWLLGPGESLVRAVAGRRPLPPLWLRRHVGPVGKFESAARETAAMVVRLGLVPAGARMLDVGCGCGAMVEALLELAGSAGRYTGFDVHEPSVRWCRRHFGGDARCTFEAARVASPYGARAGGSVGTYRFPAAAGQVDLVLAKSVFTHLVADEARRYLTETRRVLAPGGRGLLTAFLFDRAVCGAAGPRAFPCPAPEAEVRWRLASRPHAAVAYDRALFERMLADAGLALLAMVQGYWPGGEAAPRGQDTLVVGPR
jgi:ubiquinone/menaquinone biosynthesis C-methylase UbiE